MYKKQSILALLLTAMSSQLSAMHKEVKNEYIVQKAQSPYEETKSYEIIA